MYLFLLILLATISNKAVGNHGLRDAFDELVAFIDNSPDVCDIIETTNFNVPRTTTKTDVVNLLENAGVVNLLQENFFLRSNKIKSRSLLDYPFCWPWRHDKDKKAVFIDLFYNQTSRAFFTETSSNICTYLGLTQNSFLQTLQNIITRTAPFFPDLDLKDYLPLLDLFSTFTVQERRLGLHDRRQKKDRLLDLTVMAPWYYLERNHFVNPRVQEDLKIS